MEKTISRENCFQRMKSIPKIYHFGALNFILQSVSLNWWTLYDIFSEWKTFLVNLDSFGIFCKIASIIGCFPFQNQRSTILDQSNV